MGRLDPDLIDLVAGELFSPSLAIAVPLYFHNSKDCMAKKIPQVISLRWSGGLSAAKTELFKTFNNSHMAEEL